MISILISVYNAERGLEQTLASIYEQTERAWEIVMVDDGSTDKTPGLLKKAHAERPDKIRIITHRKNMGLTQSLMEAAQAARGTFLARLDAGDSFEPTKLKKQLEFLHRHPDHGLVGCAYINHAGDGSQGKIIHPPTTDGPIRAAIFRKNPFAHSAVLMRKAAYEKAGGYDPKIRYGQDYELWFRMLKVSKAANLAETLCTRNMHPDSISYKKQRQQMKQCLKTQWKYMNRFNPLHYFYLGEPLLMMLLPVGVKNYFRKHREGPSKRHSA